MVMFSVYDSEAFIPKLIVTDWILLSYLMHATVTFWGESKLVDALVTDEVYVQKVCLVKVVTSRSNFLPAAPHL